MSYHKKHNEIDKAIIGKSFPNVHKAMDSPRFLFKERHRTFLHDINTVWMFYYLFGREHALSCLLHILEDMRSKHGRKAKPRK